MDMNALPTFSKLLELKLVKNKNNILHISTLMFVEKSDPLYKHALFLMHKAWGTGKTPHVFPGP